MVRRLSENIRKITIPLHLAGVASLVYLFRTNEWSRLWWSLLFWSIISGLGIAIGYHRLLSHRAFETSPLIRRLLAFFGVFAGQGSPVFWTATHRGLHHPFSDQDRDPHSPRRGFFHAFIGWQLFFDRTQFSPRHALHVIRDPALRWISLHYHEVYWGGVIFALLVNWRMALGSLVPAMILSCHQENFVNAVGHLRSMGYRNFELPDDSNNIWILGVLLWGQALHNNHHRYPKRWNFAVRPWEFDPCSLIVPLLVREPIENLAEDSLAEDT